MEKRMRLTATGDALITRRMPLYDDPAFMGMVALIRACSVIFWGRNRPNDRTTAVLVRLIQERIAPVRER